MKDISELTVVQTRVFAQDALPYRSIGTKTVMEGVESEFKAQNVAVNPPWAPLPCVVFSWGELAGAQLVPINRITVEPRRVLIDVAASSADAYLVYQHFESLVRRLANGDSHLPEPLVLSQTTRCAATLSFSFTQLLSDKLGTFAQLVQDTSSNQKGTSVVAPFGVEFTITYKRGPDRLAEQGVTLTPKRLLLQVRANTSLRDQRYYTSSPFDSDTHLRLLDELERLMQ